MSSPRKIKSVILAEARAKVSPKEKARTSRRMALAVRIAEALAAKGWTKSHFAELMGKGPSEITKWLSGTHNFTVDTLTDIKGVLGVEFFEDEQHLDTKTTFMLTVAVPINPEQTFVPNGIIDQPASVKQNYSFASEFNSKIYYA